MVPFTVFLPLSYFSLVQITRKGFYGKIFQLKNVMINLVNLKVFGTFHLNPIEAPCSKKMLYRLLQKLLEILLVLELFWDFAFIKIFCILYVISNFCM